MNSSTYRLSLVSDQTFVLNILGNRSKTIMSMTYEISERNVWAYEVLSAKHSFAKYSASVPSSEQHLVTSWLACK